MENLQEAFQRLEQSAKAIQQSKKNIKKEIETIRYLAQVFLLNFNQFNDVLDNRQRHSLIQMLHSHFMGSFDKDSVAILVERLKQSLLLLEKQASKMVLNPTKSALPISIQGLTIYNYYNIKSAGLSIPLNASFVALTGNNAEGKTRILKAIGESFYMPESSAYDFKGQKCLLIFNVKVANRLSTSIIDGIKNWWTMVQHQNKVVAYGASRLQLQSSESQDVQNLKKSNVYNLFHNESTLLNIEHWFKIQKLKQEEARIQAVKHLLIELMPTIQDIQMGVKTTRLSDYAITYIENGKELLSEELSAGNKSILAMIGDMLIRLYDAQPEMIEPNQLAGIVLIDELEVHLHPIWQKKLPQLLVKHFPLVQFIVSTHSPIVFLGMPPDTILFNISKDEAGETLIQKINIDLANVLPNQILTSALFGMENIRNVYNQDIQQLSVETEPEIKARQMAEEQLKKRSQNFTFKLPSNDKN
ncbi:MAG: hypothetical protein RL329_4180 [Bacteroidota bacterium]|jgi:predicted ATP-binding protein involved in virulence